MFLLLLLVQHWDMLLVVVHPLNLVKLVKLNKFANVMKIVHVALPVPVLMENEYYE